MVSIGLYKYLLQRKLIWQWTSAMFLVRGFNPFEKYESNRIIFPGKGENKKHLKPPPSVFLKMHVQNALWRFCPVQGTEKSHHCSCPEPREKTPHTSEASLDTKGLMV